MPRRPHFEEPSDEGKTAGSIATKDVFLGTSVNSDLSPVAGQKT